MDGWKASAHCDDSMLLREFGIACIERTKSDCTIHAWLTRNALVICTGLCTFHFILFNLRFHSDLAFMPTIFECGVFISFDSIFLDWRKGSWMELPQLPVRSFNGTETYCMVRYMPGAALNRIKFGWKKRNDLIVTMCESSVNGDALPMVDERQWLCSALCSVHCAL